MIPDWTEERRRMVDDQLRKRGIYDHRVLDAMIQVPREKFVPLEHRVCSYHDEPAPIGFGQTISQPLMVALMAQALRLQGHERVLEVGGGCGYSAAVLAHLATHVFTVEIIPALAEVARRNLALAGCDRNVTVLTGDGSVGWPEFGPFDAISVAAGAPHVPGELEDQLAEGGVLVIPVGPQPDQSLLRITRRGNQIDTEKITECRFVPLRGAEGWR
jgi:protein-L-isoaspartate(D-aspartate) O-methyltransferase